MILIIDSIKRNLFADILKNSMNTLKVKDRSKPTF